MKRFFIIAAAALLAMVSLSSCNGKDGGGKEFGYAVITAEYRINDALSRIADITMNITKMDGTKMSMPVTTTSQVVDIDKYSKALPAVFSYSFSAKPLETAASSSSEIELAYKFTVKVYDINGKPIKSDSVSETSKNSVKIEGLADYISYFNKAFTGTIEIGQDFSIRK